MASKTSDIYMPQLGLTMTEGKVLRWLKAPGDAIEKGEPVVEIETDKVTAEVEAPESGILGPILAEPGAIVPIGGALSHVLPVASEPPSVEATVPPVEPAPAPRPGRTTSPDHTASAAPGR